MSKEIIEGYRLLMEVEKDSKKRKLYQDIIDGYEIISELKSSSKNEDVLLAPNGKPSNLNPEQYKLVRGESFISWFGDWINDPANASKVVDENGEPMQMFHNTNNKFTIFDKEKLGDSSGWETAYLGFYFGNKYEKGSYGKKTIKCFLNIRNPFLIKTEYYADFDREYKRKSEQLLMDNFFNKNKYDGILIDVEKLAEGETMDKVFVAFEPNQIKLADGTNTTFDGNNPDIRFEDGGEVFKTSKDENGNWSGEYLGVKFALYNLSEGWTYSISFHSPIIQSQKIFFSNDEFEPFKTKKDSVKSLIDKINEINKENDEFNKKRQSNNADVIFKDGGEANNYREFYEKLKIVDGSIFIGQKFSDVFPFLGRKKTPNDFRATMKQYEGILKRIEQNNYATKSMKQRDLNKLEKIQPNINNTEYLSRFYLDSQGTIINFK